MASHPTEKTAARTSVAFPPELKGRLDEIASLTRTPISALLVEAAELLCKIAESDGEAAIVLPETAVRARVERSLRGIVAPAFQEAASSPTLVTLSAAPAGCDVVPFPAQM